MSIKTEIEKLFVGNTNYTTPEQAVNQASSLDSLSDDLYTDSKRFIYELLQNADDSSEDNIPVTVWIKIIGENLVIAHSGKAFTARDLQGICNVNNGTKRSDSAKTGYKGIGFKSVFGQSEEVTIFTDGEYFRFDSSYQFAWKWAGCTKDAWEQENERKFQFPWQIIPIFTEPDDVPEQITEFINSTSCNVATIISLSHQHETILAVEDLSQNINMFLFLKNISEIVFDVSTQINISINRSSANKIALFQNNELKATWLIHSVQLSIPIELKAALKDERNIPEKLINIASIELTLGAKIGSDGIEQLNSQEKLLYSYLPTDERKYSFPVLANTSFLTTANRESLHSDSKWNQWLFKNIAIEIFKWISQLVALEYQYQAYNLIPIKTDVNDELGKKFNDGIDEAVNTIPFIVAKDHTLVKIEDAIVDFTFLSEKSFIGETPIKKFIDNVETTGINSSKKFVKNTNFGQVFKKLKASSFEWGNLKDFLSSVYFTSSHTIPLNIELIKHLKKLNESESVKNVSLEFLKKLPFIWDHKNNINYPSNVCFPTPDDQGWNNPANELSFLHLELQNWLQQDIPTRNWLEKIGVLEKTDITFITQIILPQIDSYITHENAVKTIQDLFKLYRSGVLREELIKQLSKIKIITTNGYLNPAYNSYFSNTYSPRLKIDGVLNLDIFISEHYLTGREDVDEWKRFFKILGVKDGIELITHSSKLDKNKFIGDGYSASYFEDHDKKFRPFQATFIADKYSNVTILNNILCTERNYKFSKIFWSDVIENIAAGDISKPAIAYWGYTGMPGQTTGDEVKNFLPWFIENVPCIPIASKECVISSLVLLNTDEIKAISGNYLPVFDGPELSPDWKSFFNFRTTLQLSDFLDLLTKISADTNEEGKIKKVNIDRIKAIYNCLLAKCQGWSASELDIVSKWAMTGKMLCSNHSFLNCGSLCFFLDGNESIFQERFQFAYINAENKDHPSLEYLLGCFNIKLLKHSDFKLDATERETCLELKNYLVSISPYFKNWVTNEFSDENTLEKIAKLDCNLSELQITQSETLQIRYEGIEFVKCIDIHYDANKLFVTKPWRSNSVLLKLSDVICRYVGLDGHDKKLDFLLRATDEEIQKLFSQEKIPMPENIPGKFVGIGIEPSAIQTHEEIPEHNFRSFAELDSLITEKQIPPGFFHLSTADYEKLKYAERLVKRAVTNVSAHLKNLTEYDCSNQHQLAESIIGGITKNGNEIVVVARPSDNDEVLLYYFSEFDVLDHVDSEFWCEDGLTPPKKITLGHILKKTGINRIPLDRIPLSETNLQDILTASKSEKLDFNAVPYAPQKIAKIISSFANTNGGMLLFGVKENGPSSNEIVGLSSEFKVDDIVGNAVSLLSPIPQVTYNWCKHGEKSIFAIKVEKSDIDIMLCNQKYIRNESISELEKKYSVQTRTINTLDFERVIAIIIGIENYTPKNGITPVKYAENDVKTFKSLLSKKMGVLEANIHEYVNADACKSSLEYNLKSLFHSLTEEDRLIFYYVGHGFHNGTTNFLSTYDLHRSNISETAISLNKILLEPLKKSRCKNALIFIDACAQIFQDENERSHVSGINYEDFMLIASEHPYYATFLSCQTGQSSYSSNVLKNGIWTHHIVQAMSGEISETIRENRYITDRLLSDYLSKNVSEYVRIELDKEQNPKAILDSTYENLIIEIDTQKV